MDVARTARPGRLVAACLAAGLALLTVAIYEQVRAFGFVNIDDQQYVYENAIVRLGLTRLGLADAFTTFRAGNWHPVTWLSHMADVSLFGVEAGPHHVVNVVLHALNAVLLFTFLRGATGATWRSAIVAALFAVHPLHVESVAWISERKDVLSTLFLLLALHAYLAYVRRPRAAEYLAVLALFAIGLLAKPMLVTFPFLLLLVDRWPLGRTGWRALVREKLPLFVVAAAACVATWRAQAAGAAMSAVASVSLAARIENALVSYAVYLWQAIWPSGLAAIYPHPAMAGIEIPAWHVALAGVVLCAVSILAVRERRRHPYVVVGWLWYLGTLVPVIGLVQVGVQARADRYTYVPLIGVFVAVVWIVSAWSDRHDARRRAIGVVAAAIVVALALVAREQVATWRDGETVNRHAIARTERNWMAWNGLGGALSETDRVQEAMQAFQQSLLVRPDFPPPWNGMGSLYGRMGRHDLAIAPLQQAVRLDPRYADAWYNLGTAFGNLGRHAEAAPCLWSAVRIAPDHARAWFNVGVVSLALGDRAGVAESRARLERLDPREAAELVARVEAAAR